MIANAILITIAFVLAYGFWLGRTGVHGGGKASYSTPMEAGSRFGRHPVFNVSGAVLLLQRKFLFGTRAASFPTRQCSRSADRNARTAPK
jgi:hypothetical protein